MHPVRGRHGRLVVRVNETVIIEDKRATAHENETCLYVQTRTNVAGGSVAVDRRGD